MKAVKPATVRRRKPIRTQDDPEPRCTSRFAGLRCMWKPGHRFEHQAPNPNRPGEFIRWGGRRRKR